MKRISLKDLALELNVSISTVSRALNDSPEIGMEMKMKIKKLATLRGYSPNPFAISLLRNTTRIIGIIVPDIVTHFYSSIISGINDLAALHGYSIIINSSYEKFESEKKIIEDFIHIRVEGIIACISQETQEYSHFLKLKELNIPVVFYDRICLKGIYSSVVSDNKLSAQNATLHLLDTGSKRVAFIGGANHLEIVKYRKRGYLNALRERNIPINPELVFCKYLGYETGYEGTLKFLDHPTPPDAIIAMNDSIVFGAMRAIKDRNLKIPQDIALIGYTDELHSNYVEPALTAITHQTRKIGETACKLLFKAIEGDQNVYHIIIPSSLIIRESSVKMKSSSI